MGGGKSPSIEDPPEVEPLPTFEAAKDPTTQSIRDVGARRLRQKKGHAANILSSPLGVDKESLLGKSFFV